MQQFQHVVVALLLIFSVAGCSKKPVTTIPKDPPDKDFVATISKTNKPDIFDIRIQKVNSRTDKMFLTFNIRFDLALKDSSGRVYKAEWADIPKYSDEILTESEQANAPEGTNHGLKTDFTRQLRLLKKELKPGVYTIEPHVRISESGKDAMKGPYSDLRSVPVPAGNSVKIEID